jgi:hypothetical protein
VLLQEEAMASSPTANSTPMLADECQTRCDLAACCRGPHDQVLINPYGLLLEEVTASSIYTIYGRRGSHRQAIATVLAAGM